MNWLVEWLNILGEIFVALAGPMFLQASILIAILFGLDWALRKRVRAVFRYWLWMLILIKLILPPTLSVPYSAGYWIGNALDPLDNIRNDITAPIETKAIPKDRTISDTIESNRETLNPLYISTFPEGNETMPYPTIESAREYQEDSSQATGGLIVPEYKPASSISTIQNDPESVALTRNGILFSLWILVCTSMTGLVLQRTWIVRRLASHSRKADMTLMNLLESCQNRMGIRQKISIRITSALSTPGVYGLFHPIILIPLNVRKRLSLEDLEVIVVHELAHVQRGDLWIKLFQTILQVVFFYNPLLWLANATIRKIREQAVDETVLVILGKQAGMQYPHTLLQVARLALDRPGLGLRLIGVMESKRLLAERIKIMVHKPNPESARLGFVGLSILAALAVFLLPMARAQENTAAADEVKVESPPPSQSAPASSSPGVVIKKENVVVVKDEKGTPVRVETIPLIGRLMTTANATENTQPRSEVMVEITESEVSDEILAELEQERQELDAMKQQIALLQKQLDAQLQMMIKKEQYLAQKQRQLFESKDSPIRTESEETQKQAMAARDQMEAAKKQMETARKQMEAARKQMEGSRDLAVYERTNVVQEKAKKKDKEEDLLGRNTSGAAVSVQESPVITTLGSTGINESSLDTVNKPAEATSAAAVQTPMIPLTPVGVSGAPVPAGARTVGVAQTVPVSSSKNAFSSVPAQDVSSEVRKALQEILPGLLEEMLPRIIQETMIKMEQKPAQR